MECPAVVIDGANKFYGKKDKQDYKCVLSNLNMTVEKGIIYGLLGPSGCGKTTLLSCIVGRRKLNSGNIWVLGGKPGRKGSGVPGPRVGYMPQEIALVGEFTVRDAIYYFGRIYGMNYEKMRERFEFLSDLLELPKSNQLIKTLSGGQQRRVSLAAALVHEPELLILDEPTVGLDPVLREKIWTFLADIAQTGTTVIITTHYIDETKQAHKIGLLRDGQLLAEDSPSEILRKFDSTTLEEAFLKMALRQQESSHRIDSTAPSPNAVPDNSVNSNNCYQSREDFSVMSRSTDVLTTKDKPKRWKSKSSSRYKAIFIKSFQQWVRNPNGLIFSLIFPVIQLFCLFIAVGHDPKDLSLAVVNDEAAATPFGPNACSNPNITRVSLRKDDTCEQFLLSCWFVEEMEKRNLIPTSYNSTIEAAQAVASRSIYAAIHFPVNFSDALSMRVTEGRVDDDIVDESTISTWLDTGDHQIGNYIKTQMHKAYEAFARRTMRACEKNEDLIQIPVNFATPVYGELNAQVIDYMAPGIMITIIFFMPTLVTSTLMIADRTEGVWERSAVAGVRPHEFLHVHVTLQAVVIVLQTAETVALAFGGFQLRSAGSLGACFTLLLLQGLAGMSFGFLLSVFCSSYTLSFFVATGSFYPMILLCGILWPVEAMPVFLKYIAYALPFTVPSRSLRYIMTKGSALTSPDVLLGIIVTILWTVVTLALCVLRLKLKKS